MAKSPFEQKLNLTSLESEIISLKSILDMINRMVNHQMMIFDFQNPDSTIRFHTEIHMAHFNLLLVDFLSKPKGFFCAVKNYLDRLQDICESPQLDNQDINDLKVSVKNFMDWLSETVSIEKCWFSEIGLELDLEIERKEFITICGNICKHNPTRLTWQANIILNFMRKSKQSIEIDQALISLEDFHEQFHRNIFSYHSSTISEHLNNIRWGIYTYVNPEQKRYGKLKKDNNYKYPSGIISDLGKIFYWNLMNDVISPPFIQRFKVTNCLKKRF